MAYDNLRIWSRLKHSRSPAATALLSLLALASQALPGAPGKVHAFETQIWPACFAATPDWLDSSGCVHGYAYAASRLDERAEAEARLILKNARIMGHAHDRRTDTFYSLVRMPLETALNVASEPHAPIQTTGGDAHAQDHQ